MTPLEELRDLSADLGMTRAIETETSESTCPVHAGALVEHRLETINGWQAILVCADHDGTCRYTPDQAPTPIEPPEPRESPASTEAASTGGF